MSSSTQLDLTTVVLVLIAVLVAVPLLTMGMGLGGMMGYGGMMGGYGGGWGWWPLVGLLLRVASLVVLVGGGYLVFRRVSARRAARDPAMEELRMAYARGDLSDEEFEDRRERLDGE